MPSAGVITKETVNTNAISSYTPYLSVRDCGVYLTHSNISYALFYSITNLSNITTQLYTSGTIVSSTADSYVTAPAVGNYLSVSLDNQSTSFLVYPKYGLIGYDVSGYSSTIYINYQNKTNNPVIVSPSNVGVSSVKIYYDGVEQVML